MRQYRVRIERKSRPTHHQEVRSESNQHLCLARQYFLIVVCLPFSHHIRLGGILISPTFKAIFMPILENYVISDSSNEGLCR